MGLWMIWIFLDDYGFLLMEKVCGWFLLLKMDLWMNIDFSGCRWILFLKMDLWMNMDFSG